MVLVTHAIGFVREISHRIRYLPEGRIVEIGSPPQIRDDPQDQTLKDFLRRMY
ncbi:MAG: hypothetical protein M3Z74_02205 [Pseudomonadota bacterium]|nr:hypothetical protein [Pseudomonadota bacterium]